MAGMIEELGDFVNRSQHDPLKPAKEKLAKERQEVQTERQKAFSDSVDGQVIPYRDTLITKQLEPYTRGKNISPEQLKLVHRNILQGLSDSYKSDNTLSSRYDAVYKTGDRKKIIDFAHQSLDTKLPGIVDSIVKAFGLTAAPPQKSNVRQTQRTVIKVNLKGAN